MIVVFRVWISDPHVTQLSSKKPLSHLINFFSVILISFFSICLSSLFGFQGTSLRQQLPVDLVGSSGLEPPTSRLSGARSNHLSYEPISMVIAFSSSSFLEVPNLLLLFVLPNWWRLRESNP